VELGDNSIENQKKVMDQRQGESDVLSGGSSDISSILSSDIDSDDDKKLNSDLSSDISSISSDSSENMYNDNESIDKAEYEPIIVSEPSDNTNISEEISDLETFSQQIQDESTEQLTNDTEEQEDDNTEQLTNDTEEQEDESTEQDDQVEVEQTFSAFTPGPEKHNLPVDEEKDKKITMDILYSYDNALKVVTECFNKIGNKKQKMPESVIGLNIVKDEMKGPWKIDLESAKNTLTYIYEKLHHSCYLLCVNDGKPTMYKLASTTTAPSFKKYLEEKLIDKRNMFKIRNTQWRVMGSIVKPVKKEEGFTFEYPKWINQLKDLPDGVFLMNLTDAVLLKKDEHEPWPNITGDKLLEEKYRFKSHMPILSSCGASGYWDIPIPDYDDIRWILGYDKFGPLETDWNKKINKAVFRGGATGYGLQSDTNMRLKIGTIKSDKLDAGVIYNKSYSFRFDPKHGLGYLNSDVKPVSFMKFEDQSKFKYIINIDGNVGAYRLLKSMLTKSVILKVGGMFKLWCENLMDPYVHYVPVKDDLSDLLTIIDWCDNNEEKCKIIVENAFALVTKILNKDFINSSFVKLLWELC
jgi:hypothetical protein